LLVLILASVSAYASDSEKSKSNYKWFVSIYGGPHTDENIAEIATFNADTSNHNYIVVGALAREIYRYRQWLSFELEGNVGKYLGPRDDQWAFAGLMLGRWHAFPWDRYIDTSFAMGAGLSLNSDVTQIERDRDDHAQRLLGYLAFEFTLGLPQYPRSDLMFRVHHRSGARGLIGESVSNYLCVGLKFAFWKKCIFLLPALKSWKIYFEGMHERRLMRVRVPPSKTFLLLSDRSSLMIGILL